MQNQSPLGHIEVITGCMYSGKTEELLRRLRRAQIAGHKIEVFSPSIDSRYGTRTIGSHSGQKWEATVVDVEDDMGELYNLGCGSEIVAMDEANFFEYSVVEVVEELAAKGTRVIVSGLDQTFRGTPFTPVPELIAISDEVDKLTAVCEVCGRTATKTQRLIDGEPAPKNSPTIDVGGEERYQARCRSCHAFPE